MKGWLVVNSFLKTEKFKEIYGFLQNSATEFGVDLQIKNGADLMREIGDYSLIEKPDFAIFWDKDVYLARMLESANIKLFNSANAIENCDNKIFTYLTLNGKVKIPKTVIAPKTFEGIGYSDKTFLQNAIDILGLPMVIKEAYGSFGKQVYLAKTYEQAVKIIDGLKHKDFLMQEYVSSSCGRDLRVNVVGKKVVSCMLRENENDFRSNITNGGKAYNYKITSEQEKLALSVCDILGLDFAGVDLMFGKNGEPIVCEVNSNVHFKSSFDCTKRDMSKDIIEYIVQTLSKK